MTRQIGVLFASDTHPEAMTLTQRASGAFSVKLDEGRDSTDNVIVNSLVSFQN